MVHKKLSVFFSLTLIAWSCVTVILCDPARFDNYHIFNVPVENEVQLGEMQKLAQGDKYDFMYEPVRVGQELKVFVSPDQRIFFEDITERFAIKSQLLVDNVQSLIDKEMVKSRADGFALDEFHRLDEIYTWLDSLAVTYPDIVTRIKGGDSYEGRSIEGVKLSKNPSNPAIFIEANIHANEWITSSSVLWILNELLTSTDPEVQALLDNFNWYILPVCNPDGYEYTHTTYRMWRKTRSRQGLICWGVDPNRNFDFKWRNAIGEERTSTDPCDVIYSGPSAFSEIESRSLAEFVASVKDEVKLYLSMHSAINMIMSPWGYTGEVPSNHNDFMDMLTAAHDRLHATHGMTYKIGNLFDTICKYRLGEEVPIN